jgi:hypothetical protein
VSRKEQAKQSVRWFGDSTSFSVYSVSSIEFLNGDAAAGRVTFAKDFLKVAAQKLNNSIAHS